MERDAPGINNVERPLGDQRGSVFGVGVCSNELL